MIFLPLWSLPPPFNHSYGMMLLSSGASVSLQLLFLAHRERTFVLLLRMDIGRL